MRGLPHSGTPQKSLPDFFRINLGDLRGDKAVVFIFIFLLVDDAILLIMFEIADSLYRRIKSKSYLPF